MRRIEEEQSFEELKILRELVHERFHKQEELAEVRSPLWGDALRPSTHGASVPTCYASRGGGGQRRLSGTSQRGSVSGDSHLLISG